MANHSPSLTKSIPRYSLKLFKILLSVVLLGVFIPSIPLFFLIFVLRCIVKQLAKIFRPDLAKMLTCVANACANIDSDVEKPRFPILVKFTFSGRLELQKLKEIARSQVFYLKNTEGELLYPEMQQYLTSWLGFRFWATDLEFSFENHGNVIDLGERIVTERDLCQIGEKLLVKPFHKHRSLWDVHLVHNVQLNSESGSDHTAFFFRFSHILGDGYAFLKFFSNFCKIEEKAQMKMNYPSRTIFENVLFPFKLLYVFADIVVQFFTDLPFKVPESQKTKDFHLQFSDVVPVQAIKEIKNGLGIDFTPTVIGIVVGVMRSLVLKKSLSMPESLPFFLPFPKPNHPSKLRNYFTIASLSLPIGESDPLERMRICHKNYLELKSSVFPVVMDFSLRLSGVSFQSFGKLIGENNFGVVNMSYVPIAWDRCRIDDHELIDLSYCGGAPKGSSGLTVSICSFKDRIVFSFVADKGILTHEDVMEFKQSVHNEVDSLLKLCSV